MREKERKKKERKKGKGQRKINNFSNESSIVFPPHLLSTALLRLTSACTVLHSTRSTVRRTPPRWSRWVGVMWCGVVM